MCYRRYSMKQYINIPDWLFLPSCFVVAGILIGLSFTEAQLSWCVLPGLALFFYTAEHVRTYRGAVLGGFAVGVIKSAFAVSWLLDAYPAD